MRATVETVLELDIDSITMNVDSTMDENFTADVMLVEIHPVLIYKRHLQCQLTISD